MCTKSTNASDDFAHRGRKLLNTPFYVYRMYVRRIPKPRMSSPTIFFFEPHYVLAKSYAQEVALVNISVPSIDGFQCPTVEQDAEQNALLKAILFSPWACTGPMTCGNVSDSEDSSRMATRQRTMKVALLSLLCPQCPLAGLRGARTRSNERGPFAKARSTCSLKELTIAASLLARSSCWRTPLSSQTSKSPSPVSYTHLRAHET